MPGPRIALPSGWLSAARVEQRAGVEVELRQHGDGDDRARDHQHHGLDDLHPGRGQHAAEDDVDDHEDAADQHGDREADARQRLDHGARADELGDEVDAGDQQRVDRGGDAHGPRLQAERQHVGDGELARVAHPLGQQVEHRQERQAGAEADDPAVEAVQVHQAGVAEEGRGAEVVARGRDAVGAAGDAAAGGVELGRAVRALGRPARDQQRDGQDAGEDADGQRVEVAGGGEQPHRPPPSTTRCAIRSHSGGAARVGGGQDHGQHADRQPAPERERDAEHLVGHEVLRVAQQGQVRRRSTGE